MEYLVTMTTHVPEGTPEQAVDDIRAREAAHSRELAVAGHLLVIAGERIRALAGDGVPGAVCWWPGRMACGLPGRPGLPMSRRSGAGLAGHGVPVVFETKIVTAKAAVRLAERRVLDLDVPVFGHVQALRRVPGRNPAGAPALAAVLPRSLPSAGIPGRHWSAAVAASPAGAVDSRSLRRSAGSSPNASSTTPADMCRRATAVTTRAAFVTSVS